MTTTAALPDRAEPYAKLSGMRIVQCVLAAAVLLAGLGGTARAQSFDAVGTRAAGMGGAFVAVADDASAAYWNPAGFASGSIFSLVLDRTTAERPGTGIEPAQRQSGWLLAIGAPAAALSYYRLRATEVHPVAGAEGALLQADTLVTHHAGATVVQSIAPGVAVGATLKLVRGSVSYGTAAPERREDLLRDTGATSGERTRFDADLGVMAGVGAFKAGLTLRNATAPSFGGGAGHAPLTLRRQARAGVSVTPLAGWIVAADMDVVGSGGSPGATRRVAAGTEGRLLRRLFVRGGLNAAVSGDRAAAVSAGASLAATASLLIDVGMTRGSDGAARGWGVSARVGY